MAHSNFLHSHAHWTRFNWTDDTRWKRASTSHCFNWDFRRHRVCRVCNWFIAAATAKETTNFSSWHSPFRLRQFVTLYSSFIVNFWSCAFICGIHSVHHSVHIPYSHFWCARAERQTWHNNKQKKNTHSPSWYSQRKQLFNGFQAMFDRYKQILHHK